MNYYDHPALSNSKLKDMKQSPKHFWAKHIAPNRPSLPSTDSLIFGQHLHTCILEPDTFDTSYIIEPKFDKRTTKGKESYQAFIKSSTHKSIIDTETYNKLLNMRTAIHTKSIIHTLLSLREAQIEKEFFWIDLELQIECKAKLDFFIEPNILTEFPYGLILDYKSTKNASKFSFAKDIFNFGYHNQNAFYSKAIKCIYNTTEYAAFYFIAQEKDYPYESSIYKLSSNAFEYGIKENYLLMLQYLKCIETNEWPGYEEEAIEIELPSWIRNNS